MRRGDLLVVVNFGDEEQQLATTRDEVLFATPSGVTLGEGLLTVPPHAGCLLG